MPELRAHGISVTLPPGWEGTIMRRPPTDDSITRPVCLLSTRPLPEDRSQVGDFGHGVTEHLAPDDVFVSLFEYGPESLGTRLFEDRGLPVPLAPDDFARDVLARRVRDQAGAQFFFTQSGRPFSLYCVLGAYGRRHVLTPIVNSVLTTLRVAAL